MSNLNKFNHPKEVNNTMFTENLTNFLDSFFGISSFEPDIPFSSVIPKIYKQHGINYKELFEPNYLSSFHGLMIKNSSIIKKAFLTVFMDGTVLQKILDTKIEDAIIIAHHPVEDETCGKGFLPISKYFLNQLKSKRISLYVLHSPLDNNVIISTTHSLLKLFNIKAISPVGEYHGHPVGMIGDFSSEIDFADLILQLPELFDISHINYIKKAEKIRRIAIVPGGGTDIDLILSAQKKGADLYLTGDYYNKLKLPHGEMERSKFSSIVDSLTMSLIECSHYATEKIVMEKELLDLIKLQGIDAEFINQDNPWY